MCNYPEHASLIISVKFCIGDSYSYSYLSHISAFAIWELRNFTPSSIISRDYSNQYREYLIHYGKHWYNLLCCLAMLVLVFQSSEWNTAVHNVIIIYASVYMGSAKEAHATPARTSHFKMIMSLIGYIVILPLLLALILQWINSVDVESKCIIQYFVSRVVCSVVISASPHALHCIRDFTTPSLISGKF